jgi:phosphatidate cytidylyltransferase
VTRVLSGLALLALVLAILLWLPAWGTLVLAWMVLVPAVWEIAHLGEQHHGPLPRVLMLVAASAVLLSAAGRWLPTDVALLATIVATGAVLVGEARPDADILRRAGIVVFPVLYLALPLGAMVSLRQRHGVAVVLLLLATIIVSDTAQYYGGRTMGRRPLAPRLSPKKTVEGALAGVLVGGLVLPLAGREFLPQFPIWLLWVVGLALVAFGIVGDLFESLLKRSAGVKDSSELIPGHGGVLDRIDSLLFAAPVFYCVLRTIG